VALDTTRNLYIADTDNNRIRKVDHATGTITTVAGNGTQGFSGDGGPATSAQLHYPSGVALDTAGNLYIADVGNTRVRKVDHATRRITTFAGNGTVGDSGDGGPATSAQLISPSSLAVDTAGNLYIGDSNTNRIRKVDHVTATINTVAGNGTYGYSGDGGPATSASLSNPVGVAVDTARNLYISESNSNRVRKVDHATGKITTVAGNGTQGFSGDGGPATSAPLFLPWGVAVDTAGNLYLADLGTARVRKVDHATGTIITVAGNGTQGFAGDDGPATSAQLDNPAGVSVDTAGNLYIADRLNARVREVLATASPWSDRRPTFERDKCDDKHLELPDR